MGRFVLALDQGTTSSRALLFDADGAVAAVAQREFRQSFPHAGWVEHDAEEILASQVAVARQAVADAGCRAGEVAAVGITNQRETTVVWERRTGTPIHPAIVWQDRRTSGMVAELEAAGHGELFQQRTGLVLDAYFSATKLAWILDRVPDARARAAAGELAFGTIDSWLAFRLSGGPSGGALHITDATNASRTLLYDIHRGCWDQELLGLLDIPAALLPEVRDSSAVYGELTGLLDEPVPLAGIAGDQQAASVGQALFAPGLAKNTYGTGCFLLAHTGAAAARSANRLLTTVASQMAGRREYALEGSVFMGGAVVQWLRDGLGVIASAPEVEELAASVPDTGGVYLVPAFAGLGAPYWDQDARGTVTGLTPRQRPGAPGAGGAGGDRLPGGGRGAGHGARPGRPAARVARRRRRRGQQPAAAVAGGPARPAGGAPGQPGDHRLGRRPAGRPGGGLVAGPLGRRRPVARRAPLRAAYAGGPAGGAARRLGRGGAAHPFPSGGTNHRRSPLVAVWRRCWPIAAGGTALRTLVCAAEQPRGGGSPQTAPADFALSGGRGSSQRPLDAAARRGPPAAPRIGR